MTNPKSETLFHITKSIGDLKNILMNGLYPRYCLEDVRWFGLNSDEYKFLAYPMVCFCDIPLSRISNHIDFYGSYGIGLSKNWGISKQVNPVIYSDFGGTVVFLANKYFKIFERGPSCLNADPIQLYN